MKRIKSVENVDARLEKNIKTNYFKKKLLLSLLVMSMSAFSMSGCSKDKMVDTTNSTKISTDNIVNENVTLVTEFFKDEYGSSVQRPYSNRVYEQDLWSYVILYERDVRYYNDGSIGYSNWECLGPHLVRYLPNLDGKLEYKYDFIGTVDLYNDVLASLGFFEADIAVLGDSILSLEGLKLYKYMTRDFISGSYSEWTTDGKIYLADKEYASGDLVKFEQVQQSLSLDTLEEEQSLKFN